MLLGRHQEYVPQQSKRGVGRKSRAGGAEQGQRKRRQHHCSITVSGTGLKGSRERRPALRRWRFLAVVNIWGERCLRRRKPEERKWLKIRNEMISRVKIKKAVLLWVNSFFWLLIFTNLGYKRINTWLYSVIWHNENKVPMRTLVEWILWILTNLES